MKRCIKKCRNVVYFLSIPTFCCFVPINTGFCVFIIKFSLAGVVVGVVVSTASFSVAASAVPTESPVESTKEYDDIQKMFLAIDKDTTEDDLLKLLEEYEVAYTAEDYNGTPKKRCYNIAFEEGAALQRYANPGDTLEVSFDKNDGTILYAEYFNNEAFMDALYYNYGTHWDFSEDEPGNVYSGYYYYKPGDTKGGITMKYSNGNTKETGYHSVDSAEDALGDILS